MQTYSKSVTSNFSGNAPELRKLHDEINGENGITPGIIGITMTDDNVDVIFDATLSAGEQTTLDGLLSSHNNSPIKGRDNFHVVNPRINTIKSTSYSRVVAFKYDGADKIGTIDYIDIISYKHSNITSYSARIYDKTNNNIIAEKTGMTNDVEEIHDLGTISNVPTDKAILELQMKKVGGNNNNKIYIESLNIYHGN